MSFLEFGQAGAGLVELAFQVGDAAGGDEHGVPGVEEFAHPGGQAQLGAAVAAVPAAGALRDEQPGGISRGSGRGSVFWETRRGRAGDTLYASCRIPPPRICFVQRRGAYMSSLATSRPQESRKMDHHDGHCHPGRHRLLRKAASLQLGIEWPRGLYRWGLTVVVSRTSWRLWRRRKAWRCWAAAVPQRSR